MMTKPLVIPALTASDWRKLFICVLGCQAIGVMAAFSTVSSVTTWYQGINKPFFTPPDWVFAPVWTLLYLMMGIAAFLIWRQAPVQPKTLCALKWFMIQLGFNAIWSFLFFGCHLLWWSVVDLGLMVVAIGITTLKFNAFSRNASLLMLPYLGWCIFALALNIGIWWLNRPAGY